jgi:hypothetical protein
MIVIRIYSWVRWLSGEKRYSTSILKISSEPEIKRTIALSAPKMTPRRTIYREFQRIRSNILSNGDWEIPLISPSSLLWVLDLIIVPLLYWKRKNLGIFVISVYTNSAQYREGNRISANIVPYYKGSPLLYDDIAGICWICALINRKILH